jgi:hypothetical protein
LCTVLGLRPKRRPGSRGGGDGLGGDEEYGQDGDDENKEDEDEPVPPTLRIVGYNPKTGHKSLLVVPPQAVLEVLASSGSDLGDLSAEEILTRRRRLQLAKLLAKKLRLEYPRNAPPELVVPWSGANFGFLGEVAGQDTADEGGDGSSGAKGPKKKDKKKKKATSGRPIEERPFARENRVLRISMAISKLPLVVTAFRVGSGATGGAGQDLSLNL